MEFIYNERIRSNNVLRTRKVHITPIKNELGYIKYESTNLVSDGYVKFDLKHPLTLNSEGSFAVIPKDVNKDSVMVTHTATLEPNTEYYVTVHTRNEDASSTQLFVNGELIDFNDRYYVKRMGGIISTPSDGKLEIKVVGSNITKRPESLVRFASFWVEGFYATKHLNKGVTKAIDLRKEYPFTYGEKLEPNVTDLILQSRDASKIPYKFYIIVNGVKIDDYQKPLSTIGLEQGGEFEQGTHEPQDSIFRAFIHDEQLMSMLEGDVTHVSHAFPKEDEAMAEMGATYFPRIQYFTGFSVNRGIADMVAFANEVNFAINVYITTPKVLNSVNSIMITNRAQAIMGELGWAMVRGSDYFLKHEQLYVLQSQLIQTLTAPTLD